MRFTVETICVLACAACASAQIIEIPAMTKPSSQIDMDFVALGTTSVAAMNAAGTGGGGALGRVTAPDKPGAAAGVYNTNASFGQSLARVGGVLSIIDARGSAPFDATTFAFDLAFPHTQFGVGVADWNGAMVLEFFSGGVSVGSITSTTISTSLPVIFFESTRGPFDHVTLDVDGSGGNFVVHEVWTEVPAPGSLALLAIGGLLASRRHR